MTLSVNAQSQPSIDPPGAAMSLGVVVPVFRSARSLPELANRLTTTLSSMTENWEVVFVDDGSPDESFHVLRRLHAGDSRLKVIQLARNRGQHHATLCGLHYCSAQYVFTMDDDLQAPPEELPKLMAKLQEGYDVVIGRIASATTAQRWARALASQAHRRLASTVLGKPRHLALSSFRGLSRQAVDALKAYRGAHPQITALIFKSVHVSAIANVDFAHEKRRYGSSTYSLLGLVRLSSYLLINHSYIPLRIMVVWGMILSIASVGFAGVVLVRALSGHLLQGWASLAILISFLSGNLLFAIGILGEYVGRLVEEFSSPSQFEIHRMEF